MTVDSIKTVSPAAAQEHVLKRFDVAGYLHAAPKLEQEFKKYAHNLYAATLEEWWGTEEKIVNGCLAGVILFIKANIAALRDAGVLTGISDQYLLNDFKAAFEQEVVTLLSDDEKKKFATGSGSTVMKIVDDEMDGVLSCADYAIARCLYHNGTVSDLGFSDWNMRAYGMVSSLLDWSDDPVDKTLLFAAGVVVAWPAAALVGVGLLGFVVGEANVVFNEDALEKAKASNNFGDRYEAAQDSGAGLGTMIVSTGMILGGVSRFAKVSPAPGGSGTSLVTTNPRPLPTPAKPPLQVIPAPRQIAGPVSDPITTPPPSQPPAMTSPSGRPISGTMSDGTNTVYVLRPQADPVSLPNGPRVIDAEYSPVDQVVEGILNPLPETPNPVVVWGSPINVDAPPPVINPNGPLNVIQPDVRVIVPGKNSGMASAPKSSHSPDHGKSPDGVTPLVMKLEGDDADESPSVALPVSRFSLTDLSTSDLIQEVESLWKSAVIGDNEAAKRAADAWLELSEREMTEPELRDCALMLERAGRLRDLGTHVLQMLGYNSLTVESRLLAADLASRIPNWDIVQSVFMAVLTKTSLPDDSSDFDVYRRLASILNQMSWLPYDEQSRFVDAILDNYQNSATNNHESTELMNLNLALLYRSFAYDDETADYYSEVEMHLHEQSVEERCITPERAALLMACADGYLGLAGFEIEARRIYELLSVAEELPVILRSIAQQKLEVLGNDDERSYAELTESPIDHDKIIMQISRLREIRIQAAQGHSQQVVLLLAAQQKELLEIASQTAQLPTSMNDAPADWLFDVLKEKNVNLTRLLKDFATQTDFQDTITRSPIYNFAGRYVVVGPNRRLLILDPNDETIPDTIAYVGEGANPGLPKLNDSKSNQEWLAALPENLRLLVSYLLDDPDKPRNYEPIFNRWLKMNPEKLTDTGDRDAFGRTIWLLSGMFGLVVFDVASGFVPYRGNDFGLNVSGPFLTVDASELAASNPPPVAGNFFSVYFESLSGDRAVVVYSDGSFAEYDVVSDSYYEDEDNEFRRAYPEIYFSGYSAAVQQSINHQRIKNGIPPLKPGLEN